MADYRSDHQFLLEVCDKSLEHVLHEEALHSVSKLVDHAVFDARCRDELDGHAAPGRTTIHPVWPDKHETPFVKALAVAIEPADGRDAIRKEFATTVFAPQAQAAAQVLVRNKVLASGEEFYYLIAAHPVRQEAGGDGGRAGKFRTSVSTTDGGFVDSDVAALPGATSQRDEAFDVFVRQHVIDEIMGQVDRSGENEQAGFFFGYLCRDPHTSRVFCLVTAQVEATEGVEATCTTFHFSQETFVAARAYLELMADPDLRILGWHHSHTYCARCKKRQECTSSSIFWSQSDQGVMESAFPQPYQVGLVVGFDHQRTDCVYDFKLYGWKRAEVLERGFQIIEEGERRAE